MTNITMIIPCYNEAKSIPDLFKQIELFNENKNVSDVYVVSRPHLKLLRAD